jgi:hypothetical protein
MMPRISRTTNPTSLKELDSKLFSVRVQTDASGARSFWLERFDFVNSGLARGLRLACIAHAGNTEEYFQLGSIESPVQDVKSINELANNRPLKFRFVVFEDENPRLIAFADNIRALDDAGMLGDSLVDIEPGDLGGPAWRLEIPEVKSGADKPVLLVERQLFPTPQAAAKDLWIAVLVMPEVMRQIATLISENSGGLKDPESWISGWEEYLVALGAGDISEDSDNIARSQWVDEVVAAFCAKPSMKAKFGFAINELIGEK